MFKIVDVQADHFLEGQPVIPELTEDGRTKLFNEVEALGVKKEQETKVLDNLKKKNQLAADVKRLRTEQAAVGGAGVMLKTRKAFLVGTFWGVIFQLFKTALAIGAVVILVWATRKAWIYAEKPGRLDELLSAVISSYSRQPVSQPIPQPVPNSRLTQKVVPETPESAQEPRRDIPRATLTEDAQIDICVKDAGKDRGACQACYVSRGLDYVGGDCPQ